MELAGLRPIEPGDADRLRRFHERLSPETVYRRYHGPHPYLDEGEIRFFVGADHEHHLAWVACDEEGELLGVCRLIGDGDPAERGEVAIVVEDRAQGAGVGRALLDRVLADAADHGFETVEAMIVATNRAARGLFAAVTAEREIPTRAAMHDGVVELLLDLRPGAAPA